MVLWAAKERWEFARLYAQMSVSLGIRQIDRQRDDRPSVGRLMEFVQSFSSSCEGAAHYANQRLRWIFQIETVGDFGNAEEKQTL